MITCVLSCFIKDEIKWMEKVINSKIPFLGICLGAQILAKYLGCDVVKNEKDLAEIGFYAIKPVGEGDNIFKNQNVFYQYKEMFHLRHPNLLYQACNKFPKFYL